MRAIFALALGLGLITALFGGCTTAITQGTLEGTVRTQADAQPVEGAVVSVTREGRAVDQDVTDADGRYRITNLQPGTYEVTATPPTALLGTLGAQQLQVTIAGGGTAVKNFQLPPAPATLRGEVRLPGGRAAQGATVHVAIGGTTISTTTTDEAGQFQVQGLSPGVAYTIWATLANFQDSVPQALEALDPGQTLTGLVLQLRDAS